MFQLAFQYFGSGLMQQQIFRIVVREDIEQQTAARLKLFGRFLLARVSLKHKPGDSCDLTKLAFPHLGRIQTRFQIATHTGRVKKSIFQDCIQRRLRGRQQFKAVIIDRHRECHRLNLRHSPGKECRQTFMHKSSCKWIHQQMKSLPRLDLLNQ